MSGRHRRRYDEPPDADVAAALEFIRENAPDHSSQAAQDSETPSARLLALSMALDLPGAHWSPDVWAWSDERLADKLAEHVRRAYRWQHSRSALRVALLQSCGYPAPRRKPMLALVSSAAVRRTRPQRAALSRPAFHLALLNAFAQLRPSRARDSEPLTWHYLDQWSQTSTVLLPTGSGKSHCLYHYLCFPSGSHTL